MMEETSRTREQILERDRYNHGKLIKFSEWAYKYLYFESKKEAELAVYDSIMDVDTYRDDGLQIHLHYIDGVSFNKLAKQAGLSLKDYTRTILREIDRATRDVMIERYGWRFGSTDSLVKDILDVGKYNSWARRSDALAYVNNKKCIFLRGYNLTIYILILFRKMQTNNIKVHLKYESEPISIEEYLCEHCGEYDLDYMKSVFHIINTDYYILKSKDHDDVTIRYIDRIDDFIKDNRLTNFNLNLILSDWLSSYQDTILEAAEILKPFFKIACQDKNSVMSEYSLIKILEEI